jgi:hypothetical protein
MITEEAAPVSHHPGPFPPRAPSPKVNQPQYRLRNGPAWYSSSPTSFLAVWKHSSTAHLVPATRISSSSVVWAGPSVALGPTAVRTALAGPGFLVTAVAADAATLRRYLDPVRII